jgi:acetolactate synthase I/II/III large subunit
MNISEAIVRNLELIGVEHAFGGSGAGIDDFVFALSRSKRIKSLIARHEQGASFMACGYAMFSERLGVWFAAPRPGTLHPLSALAVGHR